MTTAEASKSGGMGKDLVVYACLLALAGLQFAIAFQNIDTSQMLVRMLVVAIVEAGVGVMFFIHLLTGKRGFTFFFLGFSIFFFFALQYGWADSTRLGVGGPV